MAATGLLLVAVACSDEPEPVEVDEASAVAPAPPVSGTAGTPPTGPGERLNACERIWCQTHRENYHVDHFLEGHRGWIVHDEVKGDVFVPRDRGVGGGLPHAKREVLRLCGKHVHPYLLGRRPSPIRHTGYNRTLGYSRAHFDTYGTQLDPCCVNGLGSAYVHSSAGRQFRFGDVRAYREHPDWGWQRPVR